MTLQDAPREMGVAPLVGFRSFGFVKPHFLVCGGYQLLMPRERAEAECRYKEDHDAPENSCTCGIYAHKNESENRDYILGSQVSGEVYLWGKVIEGTRGFRAQYMYPKSLVVWEKRLWPLAPWLQDLYGVPVTMREKPSYGQQTGATAGVPANPPKRLSLEDFLEAAYSEELDVPTRRYAITQAKFRLNGKMKRASERAQAAYATWKEKLDETNKLARELSALEQIRAEIKQR